MIADILLALAAGAALLLVGAAVSLVLPSALRGRFLLGPLLGQLAVGWLVQLAYLLHVPATAATVASLVGVMVVLVWRRRALLGARRELLGASLLYLCGLSGALAAVSLTAWPSAGPWSTDWYSYLLQVEAIAKGAPMTGWELARPLLYPAATAPLALILPPLKALQVGTCALAAAALLVVQWAADEFSKRKHTPPALLWIVALSPFFLVNLTSIVSKLPQGAAILAAFLVLKGARETPIERAILGGLLIGLATVVHNSTIAYGLGFLAALAHAAGYKPARTLQLAAISGAVAFIVGGMPELLRVHAFGLDEIIRYNPSVAMRSDTAPWLLFILNLGLFFGGWGYLLPAWNIIKLQPDVSWGSAAYYGKWIWGMHVAMLSNSLVLILLPFGYTLARARRYLDFARRTPPPLVLIGLATAFPILALLHPYENSTGLVHAGATPMALGGFALGLAQIEDRGEKLSRPLVLMIAYGSVWLIGWFLVQDILVLQAGSVGRAPALDEADRELYLRSGQAAFGAGSFPWATLLLMGCSATFAIALTGLRRSAAPIADSPTSAIRAGG